MDLITIILCGILSIVAMALVSWILRPVQLKLNSLPVEMRRKLSIFSVLFFLLFIPIGLFLPIGIAIFTGLFGIAVGAYGIYLRLKEKRKIQ